MTPKPGTDQPKRGFLKLPHSLLKRALKAGLSATQWEALLLILWWSYGFKKSVCTASLSALASATGRTKPHFGRALKDLIVKGLIVEIEPSSYSRRARYSVNLNGQESSRETTVAPELQLPKPYSQNTDDEAEELRPRNPQLPGRNGVLPGRTSGVAARQHIIDISYSNPASMKSVSKTPLKVPSGDIVDSAKNAEPTRAISGKNQDSSERSQGASPPAAPAPPARKLIEGLVDCFSEMLGIEPSLTTTERNEVKQLMEGCNVALYQSAFLRNLMKIVGQPVSAQWKRPGDRFMLMARTAAEQARNGGRQ